MSLTDEWVKKNVVYEKKGMLFIAVKNDILSVTTKWIVLEDIILNAIIKKIHWKLLDFPIWKIIWFETKGAVVVMSRDWKEEINKIEVLVQQIAVGCALQCMAAV